MCALKRQRNGEKQRTRKTVKEKAAAENCTEGDYERLLCRSRMWGSLSELAFIWSHKTKELPVTVRGPPAATVGAGWGAWKKTCILEKEEKREINTWTCDTMKLKAKKKKLGSGFNLVF